jgi:ethanolamine utilization protein EutQ
LKKLITVAEIKDCIAKNGKTIYIDENTIITPAARDMANEREIKFVCSNEQTVNSCIETVEKQLKQSSNSIEKSVIDQNLIAKIVGEVMKNLGSGNQPSQLVKEADRSGLRLVKGDTVVLERFNTGNPSHKVKIKEILNTKESPNMATGFMELEDTSFSWELKYDEIDYIIDGTLEFIVDGRKYTGTSGDVFFIPANTKVTFSTPDKVKFFFVTYPANWAELSGYKKD